MDIRNRLLNQSLLTAFTLVVFGCNTSDDEPADHNDLSSMQDSASDLESSPGDADMTRDDADMAADLDVSSPPDMLPDLDEDDAAADMSPDFGPLTWVGTPPRSPRGEGEQPIVMWPRPSRAHPDVPFVYTMVAYDPEHEQMLWSLEGEPEGMTIDPYGTLHWMPSPSGSYSFTVLVDDGRGDPVRIPVTVTVDASAFLFLAPGGTGTGTIDDPMGDMYKAQEALSAQGGGTLYVRGGTHTIAWKWFRDGVKSPLTVSGNADSQVEIRGYPGEEAVIDCEYKGHGLWAGAGDWTLFADLKIIRPNFSERGGMLLHGHHNGAQNVTVEDASWSRSTNCTGFLLRGDQNLCHRCVGRNNYDRDDPSRHWNSSNYLTYPEGSNQTIYILDSYSENSSVGFKIKHAGKGQVVFHGNLDFKSHYGFGGMDDNSEISYNTFMNNGTGLGMAISDPNDFTRGDMHVHHNTVLKAYRTAWVGDSYSQDGGLRVEDNVFSTPRVLGSRDTDALFFSIWQYKEELPDENPQIFERNCYLAPLEGKGFRYGSSRSGDFSWWQEQGFDTTSVRSDALLSDFDITAPGPWSLPDDSPCRTLGDVGAW